MSLIPHTQLVLFLFKIDSPLLETPFNSSCLDISMVVEDKHSGRGRNLFPTKRNRLDLALPESILRRVC